MTLHTHTRSFGQGSRKALAIHCSLAHSGAWRGVGRALADELTMLAYDLPSHGKSGEWDRTGNVHDVATQMGLALLSEPMDLIGHSFGATVALRLAIEHPELVRSLTMIEPVYFAGAVQDDPDWAPIDSATDPAFVAAIASGDTTEAARIFNRGWGDGTRWDDIPQVTRDYMADRIHFVPASGLFLQQDSAGLLRPGMFERAKMPALLVQGSASPEAAAVINRSIARRLPDVRRMTIEGAGHMAPITHPAEVADAVRGLLAES